MQIAQEIVSLVQFAHPLWELSVAILMNNPIGTLYPRKQVWESHHGIYNVQHANGIAKRLK
jgi:hypothetical protein